MPESEELWRYAQQATSVISDDRARRAARAELYEHAVARYEEALADGVTAEEALRGTLARLGDPAEYAADLRRANRSALTPRNVGLIVALSLLIAAIVLGGIYLYMWVSYAWLTR